VARIDRLPREHHCRVRPACDGRRDGTCFGRGAGAKTPDYEAIVAAPDRSDADRQTDQPPPARRSSPSPASEPE